MKALTNVRRFVLPLACLAACGDAESSNPPAIEDAIVAAADSAVTILADDYPFVRDSVSVVVDIDGVSENAIASRLNADVGGPPDHCRWDECPEAWTAAALWLRIAELTVTSDSVIVMVEGYVHTDRYIVERYFTLKPGPRWRIVRANKTQES